MILSRNQQVRKKSDGLEDEDSLNEQAEGAPCVSSKMLIPKAPNGVAQRGETEQSEDRKRLGQEKEGDSVNAEVCCTYLAPTYAEGGFGCWRIQDIGAGGMLQQVAEVIGNVTGNL